jgi:hypothetical protein
LDNQQSGKIKIQEHFSDGEVKIDSFFSQILHLLESELFLPCF